MLVAVEEYHLHQQRPRGTRDTMYHEHTVLLACGIFIFIISWKSLNEGAQGLTLRWLYYSSLLLSSSMTSLFCSGIVSPCYTCKRLRQSHRKENGSSISALHTLPPFLHLSPSLPLGGHGSHIVRMPSGWHSQTLCRLCPPQVRMSLELPSTTTGSMWLEDTPFGPTSLWHAFRWAMWLLDLAS